jgi:hypothetical protein
METWTLASKKDARSSTPTSAPTGIGLPALTRTGSGAVGVPSLAKRPTGLGPSESSRLRRRGGRTEERARKYQKRVRRVVLRTARLNRFWRVFLRARQEAWFEVHCPKNLPGVVKRHLRERNTTSVPSLFDAKMPGKEWECLHGGGTTELGALFSLSVQLAFFVWRRAVRNPDRGPLPCVLTPAPGGKWRATCVRGLTRDFGVSEEPPKSLEPFVFAVGKTRRDVLFALAKKMGVKFELRGSLPSLEAHKAGLVGSALGEVKPEVAWDTLEAKILEDGGY